MQAVITMKQRRRSKVDGAQSLAERQRKERLAALLGLVGSSVKIFYRKNIPRDVYETPIALAPARTFARIPTECVRCGKMYTQETQRGLFDCLGEFEHTSDADEIQFVVFLAQQFQLPITKSLDPPTFDPFQPLGNEETEEVDGSIWTLFRLVPLVLDSPIPELAFPPMRVYKDFRSLKNAALLTIPPRTILGSTPEDPKTKTRTHVATGDVPWHVDFSRAYSTYILDAFDLQEFGIHDTTAEALLTSTAKGDSASVYLFIPFAVYPRTRALNSASFRFEWSP